ncbi:MAG: hypothetical protein Q9194_002774 [Teloschistes cf. exilis]
MSTTWSVYSGVATGEALALPSPTYLRTRYKNLQSRKVSRDPIPSDDMNQSFQATEHLDGPEMVAVDAVIRNLVDDSTSLSDPSKTSQPDYQRHPIATTENDPQSFSPRVDRGEHGRVATPDQDENVSVFASDALSLSESSSEDSVTTQITARPEHFRRIAGPEDRDVQRSPSSRPQSRPSPPGNVMSLGYISPDHHGTSSSRAALRGDQSSGHDGSVPMRRRAPSPVISPEEQQALAQRIQDKIAEYEIGEQKAVPKTVVHRGLRKGFNPKNLYTIGKTDTKTSKISPVPLNFDKVRQPGTPEVGSSESSSAESSLGNHVATREPKMAVRVNMGKDSEPVRGKALEKKSSGILSDEASPSKTSSFYSEESEEDPAERQAKNQNIVSWLRRVRSALKPSDDSPAKKSGKAFGSLKEKSSPVKKSKRALQDITNVRKPGYLKWNSFARDNLAKEEANGGSAIRDQENLAVHVPPKDVTAESSSRVTVIFSAGASIGSSISSGRASTVKLAEAEQELHPETEFALARLEGRVAPCPSPPFQILRSREMDYGSDVEVEHAFPETRNPWPCRVIPIGEWVETFRSLVDAGFDCGVPDLTMDVTFPKLDTLPTEILRRLVSFISCEDALTLLTVNRTFHRICNDWLIYDVIIKNRNRHGGCKWHGPPLSGADSISTWARYALADSKAANSWQWSAIVWAQCGPQLMTACHPILYERNAKSLFHMYKSSITEDQKPALIFCLALKLMSQRPPDDVARSCLLAGGRSQDADPRRELRQDLKWCMINRLISNSKLELYCQALWGQGILSILLREALIKGTVDLSSVEIVVPTTESINFHHLMDMPPPFATNTLSDFRFCHLTKMISKSYFEDGEWVGFYYTTFSRFDPPHFLPPIRNVRFITNFDPARTPSRFLSARGQDATGQFSLQAGLEDESGKIHVNQKHLGRGTLV